MGIAILLYKLYKLLQNEKLIHRTWGNDFTIMPNFENIDNSLVSETEYQIMINKVNGIFNQMDIIYRYLLLFQSLKKGKITIEYFNNIIDPTKLKSI